MTTKPEDLIVWLRHPWASPERAHGDATAQAADLIEELLAENAKLKKAFDSGYAQGYHDCETRNDP